ncbi:MAG TPA: AAA family ATPase, partial [Actinomycetota bacterium]|nr:AAA family ATPase [Actinomycetota bacterium]
MTLESEQARRPLAASGASGLRPPDEGSRLTLVEDTYGVPQDDPRPADTAPDGSPLTILVVDRKGTFSADIERAARMLSQAHEIVVESHPTRLVEQLAIQLPDVVLASPEEMTTTGLRRLAQVHRAAPKCLIALTQTQGGPVISMTDAAACGASEAIIYPASSIKLRNALARILAAAESLRAERVVIREVITEVPAAPLPVHELPAAAPAATAKVYTVTSPTGGCGKTFFATNLAGYLAGATGGRVLLVDLDLQFGEVSLALGLRPQRTISELINEENLLEAFPEYVVTHSAGYQVLSAPADPFAAELVGPRETTQVLEAARASYDYIVVDTPPSLNEVVLAAFDQSRYLVVMATMDVPSLRNLKVFLETIERLKLPAEDVSCVLNKAEPDNGIKLDELLRVYPGGFAAVLPYAKEVSRSLNLGKPVLMTDPRADISQKILEAGSKLVPAAEIKNSGWLARPAPRSPLPFRRKHANAPAASIAPGAEPAGQPGRGYQPG